MSKNTLSRKIFMKPTQIYLAEALKNNWNAVTKAS